MIEFQFPGEGLNLGNLIIVIASLLLVFFTYIRDYGIVRPTFHFLQGGSLPYMILIVLCFLSVTWSVSRADTFVQSAYAAIIFLGCIAASRYNMYFILSVFLKVSFLFAIMSLVAPLVSSGYAFQEFSTTGVPELRGVFKHQQRLSLNMAAAIGIFFICIKNKNLQHVLSGKWYKWRHFMIVIMMLAFVAAQARLFSLFFVVALVTCLFYRDNQRLFNFLFSLIFLLVAYNFEMLTETIEFYDNDEFTLTGRTTVWTRTYITAMESMVFGYGFATFDTEYFDYLWFNYRPPHAHNSFLQAFIDIGIVGFFCLIATILGHVATAVNYVRIFNQYSISLFLVILGVLSGLTGVVYFGKPSTMMTLMLLFLCIESRANFLMSRPR